jgi:hypothetical protein
MFFTIFARPVAHASACSGELQFAGTAPDLHVGEGPPAKAGSGTLNRAPRGAGLFKGFLIDVRSIT